MVGRGGAASGRRGGSFASVANGLGQWVVSPHAALGGIGFAAEEFRSGRFYPVLPHSGRG